MSSSAPDPRPRRLSKSPAALFRELRARGLLLPLVVAVATAATLIQGVLGKEPAVAADLLASDAAASPPPAGPALAPPAASVDFLDSLRPGLEKTPLSYLADYWLQLGAVARSKLVRIGDAGWPAVVLLRGLVLAPLAAAEPALAERRAELAASAAAGTAVPAPPAFSARRQLLLGVDVEMGVALFRVLGEEAATAFSAAAAEEQAPGSLLAAVSLAPGGGLRVVPGHLASTRPLRDTAGGDLDAALALPAGLPMAAVVDLDGALVGVAVAGEGGTRLWSYGAVARVVARLTSDPTCRSLAVVALEPAIAERLGLAAGALVERIRAEAYAPPPSIRPGDVLLEWNGEQIENPQQFDGLYMSTEPGARVRFRALRGARRVSGVTVMPGPDCRPVGEPARALPSLGISLEWGRTPELAGAEGGPAWLVTRVDPGGAGASAGLAAGDWIVAVEGRPWPERSLAPLERLETGGGPLLLTVRRGERVRLVLAGSPAA